MVNKAETSDPTSLPRSTQLMPDLLGGLYELATNTPDQASRIATTGTRTILAALR